MRMAACLLLVMVTGADARSTNSIEVDGARVGSVSTWVNADNNVEIIATVSDPAGLASIAITGNGAALVTCMTAFVCRYTWARTKMLSGDNALVFTGTGRAWGAPKFIMRSIIGKP